MIVVFQQRTLIYTSMNEYICFKCVFICSSGLPGQMNSFTMFCSPETMMYFVAGVVSDNGKMRIMAPFAMHGTFFCRSITAHINSNNRFGTFVVNGNMWNEFNSTKMYDNRCADLIVFKRSMDSNGFTSAMWRYSTDFPILSIANNIRLLVCRNRASLFHRINVVCKCSNFDSMFMNAWPYPRLQSVGGVQFTDVHATSSTSEPPSMKPAAAVRQCRRMFSTRCIWFVTKPVIRTYMWVHSPVWMMLSSTVSPHDSNVWSMWMYSHFIFCFRIFVPNAPGGVHEESLSNVFCMRR